MWIQKKTLARDRPNRQLEEKKEEDEEEEEEEGALK
jgi:hypothetical protein